MTVSFKRERNVWLVSADASGGGLQAGSSVENGARSKYKGLVTSSLG